MKTAKITLTLFVAASLQFACSSGSKQGHAHEEHSHDMHEADEKSMESNGVTSAYLDLKNALVATDASQAIEKAKALEMAFHAADFHSEAEIAKAIHSTDDVEVQRKAFKALSERMYELASSNKLEFNTLYKQYCPMAFDDTGAFWLSDSKEIRNPYFGDKMLKCGRVEETLAKK